MKKILLTTTALATLFAGVAAADGGSNDLTVAVGGSIQAQAGFRSQKSDYLMKQSANGNVYKRGITPGNDGVAFDTVSAMHASVKGKADSGMIYGAQVGIQSTTRSQLPAGQNAADRTFLFMEGDMGRVEVGTNSGVSSSMRIGADSIARATGGIDGQWGNYVKLDTFQSPGYLAAAVDHNNFLTSPTLSLNGFGAQNSGSASANSVQGDEKSRKITYYTPTFNGFQVGVSYTPDNRNTGQDYIDEFADNAGYSKYGSATKYVTTAKNAVAAGINWTCDMAKDQALKLSLVGETATSKANQDDRTNGTLNKYKKVGGAIFGAQYNYENVAFAASYGTRGKSGHNENVVDATTAAAVKMNAASFWTAGVAYVQGPIGASLTYMNSSMNKNKMDLVSLGMDYQLAPGLLPFAEITHFKMKQKNTFTAATSTAKATVDSSTEYKNKGTAFILGTKINF